MAESPTLRAFTLMRSYVLIHIQLLVGGGIAFIIQKKYLSDKTIEFNSMIPGRVACLRVTCVVGTMSFYNVHLEGEQHDLGSKVALARATCETVKHGPSDFICLFGYFNSQ